MDKEVFEILDPGLGASLQDRGRRGWKKFGVPPGGVMDAHAAQWANRVLDNPDAAPVLELLLQGARLLALRDSWIAITGADADANLPLWRAVRVRSGDIISFPCNRSGVWCYVAVECGFEGEHRLGSVSVYARGGLGRGFAAGDQLHRARGADFQLGPGVAGRIVSWQERRQYVGVPTIKVWPAPQWDRFTDADRRKFFGQEWTIAARSDRVGYRMTGEALAPAMSEIISEPVLPGSIQIPENGLPIVTMRDGPTVGGYPKLGWVDPEDLNRVAQCRPGTRIKFTPAP
jgi:5-oxoprolinase (ATP-hydrolysing) subunit C